MLISLLSRVKGRPVSLDRDVPAGYLLRLIGARAIDYLRGLLLTRKSVFLARSARVRHPAQLFLGKGVEIGPYCLVDCLSRQGLTIGDSSKIGAYSFVKVSGSLSDLGDSIVIGRNVAIGEYAHIGGAGPVTIGDDTITGAYLSIHPENHNFDDTSSAIRLQGVTRKGISIGKNCWIGAKVTILDGATIGDGCVIAAGAVVTQSFSDNQIIGGIPAKVIGSRGSE
jgi:acetyltransferase-like isoleucine patch superfamily enzyme